MFLKKLLLFIGFISIIHAVPVNNENVDFEIQQRVGNSYILFKSTIKPKTWIGIYKKDKSNEWKNVRKWEWATEPITKIGIKFLTTGDYEARLFFNNSFITEKVISFHIEAGPAQRANRLKDTSITLHRSASFTLRSVITEEALKNWVGVFSVGAEHKRANLLAWGYLEKDKGVTINTLNGKKLPLGNYDMVYFIDNSYNQIGDTVTLSVITGFNIFYNQNRNLQPNAKFVLQMNLYQNVAQENDWVAMFKKEDAPTRENIIAWSYIKDGEVIRENEYWKVLYFSNFPKKDIYNTHKIVVFSNDSYKKLDEALITRY